MSDGVSRDEFEQLLNRVEELEEQLDGSDESDTGGNGGGVLVDRRDGAVLSCLGDGTTVRRAQLESLYRAKTDIRNSKTIERRIKSLVQRDEFDNIGLGKWRYTEVGDD